LGLLKSYLSIILIVLTNFIEKTNMKNNLFSVALLILIASLSNVIYSSKVQASFTMTACKHNGKIFAVIETGESCIAAHQAISGAKTLHSTANGYLYEQYIGSSIPYTPVLNIHSSNCILTESISGNIGD